MLKVPVLLSYSPFVEFAVALAVGSFRKKDLEVRERLGRVRDKRRFGRADGPYLYCLHFSV